MRTYLDIILVEDLNKILSRDIVDGNMVNDSILSVLAGFILQLSPFAEDSKQKLNEKNTVDDCIVCLEAYFRHGFLVFSKNFLHISRHIALEILFVGKI